MAEAPGPVSAPGGRPLFDPGNPLLAGGPALWDTGVFGLPAGAGNAGVFTMRTASTSMTLIMTADDLDRLAGDISSLAVTVREAPVLARPSGAEISALGKGNGRPGVA
jgi:hypothetical protein